MADKPMSLADLNDIDLIRTRPAMFVGNTGERGLRNHCEEAIDFCLDPAVRGRASRVDVVFHRDGSVSVQCDGLAPPAVTHEENTPEALTAVFTAFRGVDAVASRSKRKCLLIWIGDPASINALAERFEFTVWENGEAVHVAFERGLPITVATWPAANPPAPNATRFRWRPDAEIFGDTTIDLCSLRMRLRLDALLARGITTSLTDERSGQSWTYRFDDGPGEFVEILNSGSRVFGDPIHLEHQAEWGQLSTALQYHAGPGETHGNLSRWHTLPGAAIYFANHRRIVWGTPAAAFWDALERVWSEYIRAHDPLPEPKCQLQRSTTGQCLRAVVSVRLTDPIWGGPVRQTLMNDDLQPAMEAAIYAGLAAALPPLLDRHPWLVNHVRDSALRLEA